MIRKDTSAAYTMVLSDKSIAFKELDDHVIVFIALKDGWLHVFRYRKDGGLRKIDKTLVGVTLKICLESYHIDEARDWKIFEEYEDQDLLARIEFLL